MLYLAIVSLLVLAVGSIALLLGVKHAKDGCEDAEGFHGGQELGARGESSIATLGSGVVHLPRQQR